MDRMVVRVRKGSKNIKQLYIVTEDRRREINKIRTVVRMRSRCNVRRESNG